MQGYKQEQEQLFEVSKDRLRLAKELKESTDESLELMDENERLKKMVAKLQELNGVLTSRHEKMEGQLAAFAQKDNVKESLKGLSEDYDSIISSTLTMQKEMGQLSHLAARFEELSLPIRIIRVAFNSNSNLRELVMRQAEQELGANPELREIFRACTFEMGEVLA
jgi:hypothetical protein